MRCLSLLLCLAACQPDMPPAPTTDEACDSWAAATCARLDSCDQVSMTRTYGEVATCTTRQKIECLANLAATGTVRTTTNVKACGDALATAGCEVVYLRVFPDACKLDSFAETSGSRIALWLTRLHDPDMKPARWRDLFIAGWAGLRGAVTLAAALSLPLVAGGSAFPGRDLLIFLASSVIVITLVPLATAAPSRTCASIPMSGLSFRNVATASGKPAIAPACRATITARAELLSGMVAIEVMSPARPRSSSRARWTTSSIARCERKASGWRSDAGTVMA